MPAIGPLIAARSAWERKQVAEFLLEVAALAALLTAVAARPAAGRYFVLGVNRAPSPGVLVKIRNPHRFTLESFDLSSGESVSGFAGRPRRSPSSCARGNQGAAHRGRRRPPRARPRSRPRRPGVLKTPTSKNRGRVMAGVLRTERRWCRRLPLTRAGLRATLRQTAVKVRRPERYTGLATETQRHGENVKTFSVPRCLSLSLSLSVAPCSASRRCERLLPQTAGIVGRRHKNSEAMMREKDSSPVARRSFLSRLGVGLTAVGGALGTSVMTAAAQTPSSAGCWQPWPSS